MKKVPPVVRRLTLVSIMAAPLVFSTAPAMAEPKNCKTFYPFGGGCAMTHDPQTGPFASFDKVMQLFGAP
ncbi:hypothetical protein ACGFNU_34560 [Spirillospora sp. NPDC048911]|uniref:hypothetical protein n=1 Tax=Spirillospora sp. NPDC048911 TaxID=3364527 RepID=UPI003710F1B5